MPIHEAPASSPNALLNTGSLLDWVCDTLVATYNFVDRYNVVNTAANECHRWIERAQANTFLGDAPLTCCMVTRSSVGTALGTLSSAYNQFHDYYDGGIALSYLDFATAAAASANYFDDVVGTPLKPTSASQSTGTVPVGIPYLGTNFIRARLIVSPTADQLNPDEPLSFIVVVEFATGLFTMFGFGEVVKLTNFTGGIWCSGQSILANQDIDYINNYLFGAGHLGTSLTAHTPIWPTCIWSSDWGPAVTLAGGYGWLQSGAANSTTNTTWPLACHDIRGILGHIIPKSPSSFSLQSEKYPSVYYGGLNNDAGAAYLGHAPMAILPDIFIADISNVDAYGVFQDTIGEKYMVVPYRTKVGTGLGKTGRFGILLRNPDLTVTI